MSKAYKNGRKAAREWMRNCALCGREISKPVCPYNGPELYDEWQAGFDSIAGHDDDA